MSNALEVTCAETETDTIVPRICSINTGPNQQREKGTLSLDEPITGCMPAIYHTMSSTSPSPIGSLVQEPPLTHPPQAEVDVTTAARLTCKWLGQAGDCQAVPADHT